MPNSRPGSSGDLAIIPLMVEWLRRLVAKLLLSERASHRQLRRRVAGLLLAVVFIDALGIILMHRFEPRPTNDAPSVRGWGDAAEWTTAELLAAGSSRSTGSEFGQVFEVVLQACAVTVVASLAGSLGAFFHRRGLERDPLELDADPSLQE
jgi:hypothetical protein